MFNKLINFGYQRSWVQAIGFYITYLLLAFASALLIERMSGISIKASAVVIGLALTLLLSFLVLVQKKQQKNILYVSIAIVGCLVASYQVGILLGLLFPSYLSTLPMLQSQKEEGSETGDTTESAS
jgi:uncharacterized membrane protein